MTSGTMGHADGGLDRIQSGAFSSDEMEELKTMVVNLKEGRFFEALTMEFKGKLKKIGDGGDLGLWIHQSKYWSWMTLPPCVES